MEKINLTLQSGLESELLTFDEPFIINEDAFYKIKAFFSIFNGYFDFNISHIFHKYCFEIMIWYKCMYIIYNYFV